MGPYQRTPKEVARAIRFSGFFGVRGPWVLLEISSIFGIAILSCAPGEDVRKHHLTTQNFSGHSDLTQPSP